MKSHSSTSNFESEASSKKKWLLGLAVFVLCLMIQGAAFEWFERFLYTFEARFSNPVGEAPVNFQGLPQEPDQNTPMYVYDHYGFRTWGIDYDHKKGKRIVFVGSNSMGMGYGVKVSQTFPSVTWKKMLQLRPGLPIEVINLNLPGNPLPRNIALLKDTFLNKIQPDLVIYGEYLYQTDLFFPSVTQATLSEQVFNAGNINFANGLEAGNETTTTQSYFEHSKAWTYLVDHSLLMAKSLSYLDTQVAQLKKFWGKDAESQSTQVQKRAGYLYDLHAFLKQHQIPLVVVTLPNTQRNALHQAMFEASKELGIPYFPLDQKRKFSDYTLVENGHYSADSNAILGADIAHWLDGILDEDLKLKASYTN